jgi:hypothetical protein
MSKFAEANFLKSNLLTQILLSVPYRLEAEKLSRLAKNIIQHKVIIIAGLDLDLGL